MRSDQNVRPEEILQLSNAAASGKRPYFFDNPDVDRLLAIVMAMAGELAVTRERLDTVERLLETRRVLERELIENYRPGPEAARERGEWQLEYISRLLRILQQETEQLQRGSAEVASEDVSRELASK